MEKSSQGDSAAAARVVAAKASMPIRASRGAAFSAFVEPEKLVQFWLARAEGPLRLGATVRWEFKVPGAQVDTQLEDVEPDQRLRLAWSDGTRVDLTFSDHDGGCVVAVSNTGFSGSPEEIVARALDATEGFTIVLCDLKTFLETGKSANLVRDKARLIEQRASGN